MDIEKKFSYLDQFKIIKTLGAGYHAQVKLGVDQNGRYVAIKRYKKETANLNTLKHELNIMKELNHENLVKLIDVRQKALYKSRNETTYECFAIILQYVGGGQLFDYIADTGKFSQKVSRTYFHQLMNGLHHMHKKGYAHRDIKPQNILLSHQFILKLADFGFSCLIKGKDNSGVLHTKLGTEGYMAPQIPSKNYQGTKTDIFAAGVILFIMYAGNPPFEKAAPNDPYYKLIKEKNYGVFWNAHSRRRPVGYFSDKFKDIFTRMVAFEPEDRLSIEQIAKHPWITEPVCTYPEIKQQFSKRQEKLDKVVDARRQEEQKKKQQRMTGMSGNVVSHRGQTEMEGPFFQNYLHEKENKRKFPPLQPLNKQDFVIHEEVPYLISTLKGFFEEVKIEIGEVDQEQIGFEEAPAMKVSKVTDQNSNQITVAFKYDYGTEQEEISEVVEVKMIFGSRGDDITVCLERESGNLLYYKKIVRAIRNCLSYCIVE